MNNEHNLKSSNRKTRKSDDKKAEGLLLHLENNYGYTAAAITWIQWLNHICSLLSS